MPDERRKELLERRKVLLLKKRELLLSQGGVAAPQAEATPAAKPELTDPTWIEPDPSSPLKTGAATLANIPPNLWERVIKPLIPGTARSQEAGQGMIEFAKTISEPEGFFPMAGATTSFHSTAFRLGQFLKLGGRRQPSKP